MKKIPSSEITPEQFYLSRRKFLKQAAVMAVGAGILVACKGKLDLGTGSTGSQAPGSLATSPSAGAQSDEYGRALTEYDAVTNFNNYYVLLSNICLERANYAAF